MNNERILSHQLSRKLTVDELEEVSAGGTSVATGQASYSQQGGTDAAADVNFDM